MNSLGQRIRELRMKKGFTQIDLAQGLCTPSMISQIESNRARPSHKMLSAIAERLQAPLEMILTDVQLNLEYVSLYKMAKAMLASREYAPAIPMLRELLEMPRASISTMDILFDLGECYLYTDQLDEAEKTFSQVQEYAILQRDHLLNTKVMKHLGELELFRKRYPLAAFHWEKALEESRKMEQQDGMLTADILYALGTANLKLGSAQQAIAHFEQASAFYESMESLEDIGRAYLGLSKAFRQTDELERAVEYSERAASVFETLENLRMSLHMQVSKAALYGQVGRLQEAEALLEEAVVKLRHLGRREEEGVAVVELAHVKERLGETAKATDLCRQGRFLLPELHVYQGKINRLLGRVAVRDNDVQEAARKLKMAADVFKMQEEVGEWEETMYELSRVYLQEEDLPRVVGILEEMRSYSREVLAGRGIEL